MEVTDRIASLEQRVQMQEDEIQLLKSALADVVRRLNVSEEQQAMGSRRGPTKGKTCFLDVASPSNRANRYLPVCLFRLFPEYASSKSSLLPFSDWLRSPLPPPFCPFLLDCVLLLNVLCVLCIDPALMRKSPSTDSNVGKSGRL